MNSKSKHEKILKVLAFTNLDNFMESLSSIEYVLQISSHELQHSIVPLEANFQIPNIFLKTRKSFKMEKLLSEKDLSGNWNESLDKAIEFLDGIELDASETNEDQEFNEPLLEELIGLRYGSSKTQ